MEQRRYPTPCLISTLAAGKDGYVRQSLGGKKVLAHRAEFERVHGEIEDGLEIDHKCCERACIDVDHLEAVDRRENLRRCGKCKLTRANVIEIRRCNEPQHVLAERYGITQSHVSRIKAGLVWRDVLDPEMSTDPDSPRPTRLARASEEPHGQTQPIASISKLAA